MELVYLIATGFFAGIVGSLLGLGGGIILVPALTLIFGLPMTEAVNILSDLKKYISILSHR